MSLPARPACLLSRTIPQCRTAFIKRCFLHTSPPSLIVKPFLLADIGEGITECQLIQWFVQPGARVEQFDKLCEVQSDKASVEITSPFDGVIKKLYYEPDDMAVTGKALVDIDIQSEISDGDAAKLAGGTEAVEKDQGAAEEGTGAVLRAGCTPEPASSEEAVERPRQTPPPRRGRDHSSLATPAVRHWVKEHGLSITDMTGTGKDGRVLKEDVQRHVSQGKQQSISLAAAAKPHPTREDRKVSMTPGQTQMFKTMTRSLNIPHFLYTSAADMTSITALRKTLNASAPPDQRLTPLAFIFKAVSIAFARHPLLNSSLDSTDPKKPEVTQRGAHNFGVAIDAPAGLVVPVAKNIQDLSIAEIAAVLRQLSEKARGNKLSPQDFSGATFTISNIGSVGGGVVSPVVSEPQVAILGVGRSKTVPAFDANEQLIKKEELVLSWSADHRVVDGAECARCAERVRALLEDPASMMVEMR